MCMGKIKRVWVQNEPIKAFKLQKRFQWSVFMEGWAVGRWYHAIPQIIIEGGGSGVQVLDDQGLMAVKVKSVRTFLSDEESSFCDEYSDVQLTGWHAHRSIDLLPYDQYTHPIETVYEVELRGLIQESLTGELVASEMRVVRRVE